MDIITQEPTILSVTTLNRMVKQLLESKFPLIWVEGEISNLSCPHSGHIYFTLKDQQAQIRCALFRSRSTTLPFTPANGMLVVARAKISLYEGRGDYQLLIEQLETQGEGLLRRRFEQLKNKLASEGLFDLIHKKPLPRISHTIGIITSATGAAIQDILTVLKRRFAATRVIIYPTQVQGEQAIPQIVKMIELANLRQECDVLLLCRGGGSLEDLWAFNEELVARAIFKSQLAIITGIGHETDYTIADLVADHRAPTPSAAAELVTPDAEAYQHRLSQIWQRLNFLMTTELRHAKAALMLLQQRLQKPEQMLQRYSQTLDLLELNLIRITLTKLTQLKNQLQLFTVNLTHLSPSARLHQQHERLKTYRSQLNIAIKNRLEEAQQQFLALTRTLQAVSPLQTLERGYSITTSQGHVIDDVTQIEIGESVRVEVKNGYLFCDVTSIEDVKFPV